MRVVRPRDIASVPGMAATELGLILFVGPTGDFDDRGMADALTPRWARWSLEVPTPGDVAL